MKLLCLEIYEWTGDVGGEGTKKFLAGVDVHVNALLPSFSHRLLVPAVLLAAAHARKVKASGEYDASEPPVPGTPPVGEVNIETPAAPTESAERRAYRVKDLPAEIVEAIKASKMEASLPAAAAVDVDYTAEDHARTLAAFARAHDDYPTDGPADRNERPIVGADSQ